jgi:hypothetical protein
MMRASGADDAAGFVLLRLTFRKLRFQMIDDTTHRRYRKPIAVGTRSHRNAASFKSLYQKRPPQILIRLPISSSAVASDTTLGLIRIDPVNFLEAQLSPISLSPTMQESMA